MPETPVDTDAADVDVQAWAASRPSFTPDVVDADPSPSDIKDYDEEPDA